MAQKAFLLVLSFVSAVSAGEAYHHPTGLTLTPPEGWSVRESKFTDLQLVPPDPSSNDKGPTESYFLLTIGVTANSVQDPQLLQQPVDSLMNQIAPFLKRTGDMEPSKSGGLQTWEGKSPSGQDVLADVYVLPSRDVSFVQISLGEKERILLRRPALRDLYKSFRPEEGKREPTLVGRWIASATSENQEKIDSSMQFDSNGSFSATQNAGEQQDIVRGRWYSLSGKLFLVLENAPSINLQFKTEGDPGNRALKLIHANGEVEELRENVTGTTSHAPD